MPLAFESESHGKVAFGFFNIETDMLILGRYFFFAVDFCREIIQIPYIIANKQSRVTWNVYDIPDYRDIGDLHGAIAGTRFIGFIGEVYQVFPFPSQPEGFKQKTDGHLTRHVIEKIIERYGKEISIPFSIDERVEMVMIGEYVFSYAVFQALIRYVLRGGYPRWEDDRPPHYVLEMKAVVEKSRVGPFNGLQLDR